MFEKLGHIIVRRRKAMVILFIISVLTAGTVGTMIFSRLDSGGYSNPNSDSYQVYNYLNKNLKISDPNVVVVVDSGNLPITDPAIAAKVQVLEAEMAKVPRVTKVVSYWNTGGEKTLAATDGKAAYILVYGQDDAFTPESQEMGDYFQKNFDGKRDGLTIYSGGVGVVGNAINKKIADDLKIAEAISIPLTFILLVFVFGAMAASAMPLLVGVSAILGAFFLLYLISLVTSVSVYALNLTTGMGLGLGIDYALLIVNRFREELHRGKSVEDSIVNTMASAGKTVFYSGLTVLVTLFSLTFFPLPFLKSFGYAGVSVVAIAVAGALFGLPPILAMLGKRVDKGVVRKSAITHKDEGRWAQTARLVMKRPVAVVLLSLIILGILAAPVKDIAFSQGDSRILPASNAAAVATAMQESRFESNIATVDIIVLDGASKENEISSYIEEVKKVPGIVSVTAPRVIGDDIQITAYESMLPRSPEAQKMIHDLRDLPSPAGTLVGGVAADYTDTQDGISETLPLALGWIAISVLILLFVFTGSIILPIKAVLLNIMSLAATMGALTWIFVGGHLQWLVGSFTVTGSLDTSIVILIFVVVFGLSGLRTIFAFAHSRRALVR